VGGSLEPEFGGLRGRSGRRWTGDGGMIEERGVVRQRSRRRPQVAAAGGSAGGRGRGVGRKTCSNRGRRRCGAVGWAVAHDALVRAALSRRNGRCPGGPVTTARSCSNGGIWGRIGSGSPSGSWQQRAYGSEGLVLTADLWLFAQLRGCLVQWLSCGWCSAAARAAARAADLAS
jgi:hypothetical protein